MTLTQKLIAGLLADGWTRNTTGRSGALCYSKTIPGKVPYVVYAYPSSVGTLRCTVHTNAISKSMATPKRAARLIALGSPATPEAMLNELESL